MNKNLSYHPNVSLRTKRMASQDIDHRYTAEGCYPTEPRLPPSAHSLPQEIRAMGKRGDPVYSSDGQSIVEIPPNALGGRIGTPVKTFTDVIDLDNGPTGKTFTGVIDLENGTIRIDSPDSMEFYLTIDLKQVPQLYYSPDQPGAIEALAHAATLSSNAP